MRIERVVHPDKGNGRSAEFLRDGTWLCCQCWFEDGEPLIATRARGMTPEQAGVVAVALQMAIEWIAEEVTKRT